MYKLTLLTSLLLAALSGFGASKLTTYSGKITGYSTSMGFKTGNIYVHNAVTGLSESHLIAIDSLGSYTVTFPVDYDRECFVRFPFSAGNIYFKKGGKLIQDFDISVIPVVKSAFKGDGARVNTELYSLRPIFKYDWDKIDKEIYQMSPEAYKKYHLSLQNQKLKSIDSMATAGKFDKLSRELASSTIRFTIASRLMDYNYNMDVSNKRMNNIPFDKRIPVEMVALKEDYYDFLKDYQYNSRANWASAGYNQFFGFFVNLPLIADKIGRNDYTAEIEAFEKKGDLNDAERTMLRHAKVMNGQSYDGEKFNIEQPKVLRAVAGTDISLELDILKLRKACGLIQNTQTPLADSALSKLKDGLKNSSLISEVIALNEKVKSDIATSRMQTGYAYNETPKVATDSIFNNIVRKYKGKAILVDFWATWCVPCLEGMKDIAPVKEELKNEEVVFLYITNNTSPDKAYEVMMPGIKGEHYKVSAEEYNAISERFAINGIPHYMVVDKKGTIVANRYQWGNPQQVKLQLLHLAKQ